MNKFSKNNRDQKNLELTQNIHIYNSTTDRAVKTEMVHQVYDLGFDELAEAMTDAIYGQTNNLKYVLGEDFTVTDENNYAKPTFLQDWFRVLRKGAKSPLISFAVGGMKATQYKVNNYFK